MTPATRTQSRSLDHLLNALSSEPSGAGAHATLGVTEEILLNELTMTANITPEEATKQIAQDFA